MKNTLIVLDVDGVLTDGTKIYDKQGLAVAKRFNDRDFTAIKIFRAMGIKVVFLTADTTNANIAVNRNIDCWISRDPFNRINKRQVLLDHINSGGYTDYDIWYVGDDYFDAEVLSLVTMFCPSNASFLIKPIAHRILSTKGGEGVVEELLHEFLITSNRALPTLEELKEIDAKEHY